MKITLSSVTLWDLSVYHDREVSQFIVDYANHCVQIPLKLHAKNGASEKTSMMFRNVKSLRMNIDEKWGPGIYIYEIVIKDNITSNDNEGQAFSTTILLNSGDEIDIVCESIEICDDT